MKNIFLLIVITCLFSCSSSIVTKKLDGADSLVIVFNKPNSDTILKTVNTTEEKAIEKLARFIDGKETGEYKCGYDGNIIFYSKGTAILKSVFRYSANDCRHFMFDIDNKVMTTKMSDEAVDFLTSLAEGKNWY